MISELFTRSPTFAIGDKVTWRQQKPCTGRIAYSRLVGTIIAVRGSVATVQRKGPHRPVDVALARLEKSKV